MSLPVLPVAMLAFGAPVDAMPMPADAAEASSVLVIDLEQLNGDATMAQTSTPLASEPAPPATDTSAETSADEVAQDDLVVQARQQVPGDPLESINAETFQVVSKVDEAVIEPVAMAYRDGLPRQVRSALSNFFSNLREPVVVLNYLLQLKPGKAIETVARFAINSTIGVAGLIDVAEERPFNLPYRRNGFANTLGYYGVGQGPFLVVPLVGGTTLRDMIGNGIDQLVMPLAVGRPFTHPAYGPIAFTVSSLDYRIEFDNDIASYRESSDPYSAMRDGYLARRHAEIEALHGRMVEPEATQPASESRTDETRTDESRTEAPQPLTASPSGLNQDANELDGPATPQSAEDQQANPPPSRAVVPQS